MERQAFWRQQQQAGLQRSLATAGLLLLWWRSAIVGFTKGVTREQTGAKHTKAIRARSSDRVRISGTADLASCAVFAISLFRWVVRGGLLVGGKYVCAGMDHVGSKLTEELCSPPLSAAAPPGEIRERRRCVGFLAATRIAFKASKAAWHGSKAAWHGGPTRQTRCVRLGIPDPPRSR